MDKCWRGRWERGEKELKEGMYGVGVVGGKNGVVWGMGNRIGVVWGGN